MPEQPEPAHEGKIRGGEFQAAMLSARMESVQEELGYERPPDLQASADSIIEAMLLEGHDKAHFLMNSGGKGGSFNFHVVEYANDKERFPRGFDDSDPWILGTYIDRAKLWWDRGFRRDGQLELSNAAQLARDSRQIRDVIEESTADLLDRIEQEMEELLASEAGMSADQRAEWPDITPGELAAMLEGHVSGEVCEGIREMPYFQGLILAANALSERVDDPAAYLVEHGLLV